MELYRGSKNRILLLILLFSSQIYFAVGFYDTSSNSVEHVILIALDCIRPSVLETAQTPNMDLLMETGSYTYDASTVTPSNTISAIPAIFTGAPPEIHQLSSWDSSLNAESIIEVLEENGYPSAIIGESANLGGYSATYCTGFENRANFDDYYFSVALEWFTEYRPFFTFIYDPVPDRVGHQYGHESVEYREAIEKADYQVGRVLTLLRELDVFDNSLIVITTDHGLTGTGHNRQCFSIWRGPGIKSGYEIDGQSKYIPEYGWVSHEIIDIAPTILEYLGLRPLSDATGEVISAIFEPVSEPEPEPEFPPLPPLPPILSYLTITPAEIESGDVVTIGLDIENIDSQPFTYIVTMHIGELTLLIDVELEAYEFKTVSRTITLDTVGDFNVTVDGLTGSFTVKAPPKPAEFEFSNLRIFYPGVIPPEVERGQTVTVTVSIEVENVGELEDGRTVELKVDGEVIDSKGVTLEGGASATVLFELTRGEGTYEVKVEGFTDSFTVNPKPSFWDKIPGFPYESILIGLIAVIIMLWYARARKS